MSKFMPATAADADGCAPVRPWNCPESVTAARATYERAYLFAGADLVAIVGSHLLARASALYGKSQLVEIDRFEYVLRDPATGTLVTAGVDLRGDEPTIMLGGKGSDLDAAIAALESELNAATPVNCSLDVPCDGYDLKLGFKKGQPFMNVRVDS